MKQRPQNVHKRHGCMTSTKHFAFRNSETCISVRLSSKQCHDMLDFKTKLNGAELNGTMIPVVFFCPLLMHFNANITYIFFRTIHHIDPLHRKQTLTLSQCNSRDLTDTFTHKSFYTQTVLHTDASTRRRFYTQMRFTHAHTLSHINAFTHRRIDTQTLLHTDAFTRRCFLHTHTRFHTQTLLHTDAFTHRHFYTNESVHRNFSSVFEVQRPFRAKGLRLTKKNRNFASVFDVQRPFRV